ncbi:MAG: PspA/IM30 family protein [Campylobacterota bacterium]|nr:PspA/IM30 family protein [Campylobacterota bacterium]
MGESMASRVTRLISGSINALIDKAEDISPQIVRQEGIREVETMIDKVKIALGKESVKKLQLQEATQNLTKEYETLTSQIGIALEKEREDLAKSAIAKQIELESQALSKKEALSTLNDNITKLEGYIDALGKKKLQLKKELVPLPSNTTKFYSTKGLAR